ncbi:MAG TPA: hypothetical protein VLY24_19475 [Bryobacteraceae bacterium]|nr:hypothetical protein [Bryobacteraceae bacterium]
MSSASREFDSFVDEAGRLRRVRGLGRGRIGLAVRQASHQELMMLFAVLVAAEAAFSQHSEKGDRFTANQAVHKTPYLFQM